jgi:hypothetical protein
VTVFGKIFHLNGAVFPNAKLYSPLVVTVTLFLKHSSDELRKTRKRFPVRIGIRLQQIGWGSDSLHGKNIERLHSTHMIRFPKLITVQIRIVAYDWVHLSPRKAKMTFPGIGGKNYVSRKIKSCPI